MADITVIPVWRRGAAEEGVQAQAQAQAPGPVHKEGTREQRRLKGFKFKFLVSTALVELPEWSTLESNSCILARRHM